jgi:hypothetical protein
MTRTMLLAGLALLLVASLALTVQVEEGRVKVAQRRAAVAALRSANGVAERDSSHQLHVGVLGDSLRAAERQVVQVAQTRDALDRALGRERIARYALTTRMDSLARTVSAVSVRDSLGDVRRAHFATRDAPYTVVADVTMPVPPDSARIALTVAIDSIPIGVRVGCAPPNADGIRTASIVATAPVWARVRLGRVEQSPELCASPARRVERSARGGAHLTPLVVGLGRVVTQGGAMGWGLFVGVGLAFGG